MKKSLVILTALVLSACGGKDIQKSTAPLLLPKTSANMDMNKYRYLPDAERHLTVMGIVNSMMSMNNVISKSTEVSNSCFYGITNADIDDGIKNAEGEVYQAVINYIKKRCL